MIINELLSDKSINAKNKTELLAQAVLENSVSLNQIKTFAEISKDPIKATCIEAVEFATSKNPAIMTEDFFQFVCIQLLSKAPRIKWESARVIANTVHLFQDKIDSAITNLLTNTEHEGTVVRWSAATALSAILKLKLPVNTDLIPAIEAIMLREEKASINKIYAAALKKL